MDEIEQALSRAMVIADDVVPERAPVALDTRDNDERNRTHGRELLASCRVPAETGRYESYTSWRIRTGWKAGVSALSAVREWKAGRRKA